ncbi:hypothetical protein FRACYDRAFT_236027 [Fragilariopsis cylindrus CCMP1102]|uniref:Uncharacterized protein n=1 Tax=Fragilariopsis cylindrus CCMP1102 TaxID=635003 RepID=A0A1E7FP97_9STRA|nr:hypothetical protein FRACYDRAFT_236027 [Fragilariopsis cylindrus CCMP1102]|eukprot:OEU19966.1 hypothetical protein FRACYDRAFT_236027 [Fragilariopsis cylindrus CCMP1102]
MMRIILLLLGVTLQFPAATNGFLSSSVSMIRQPVNLLMSSDKSNDDVDDGDNNNTNRRSLRELGYSDDEIKRSTRKSDTSNNREQIKVRIDLIDNIDPVTLSAIGFGLIALNFFVFANMGDGGIGGIVAYIINVF